MIFESFPWKQDLRRRKNLIIKYNTAEHFEKNDDTTYTVIEKAIFYSAFIIRKLIDCGGKLSDESENYSLKVCSVQPLKLSIVSIDQSQNFQNWFLKMWHHALGNQFRQHLAQNE